MTSRRATSLQVLPLTGGMQAADVRTIAGLDADQRRILEALISSGWNGTVTELLDTVRLLVEP